ncbi:MAG: FecR domain-containing protein [Bacteroidales bacterium]|nr:FecR domain-containing protein [Bacteroidales bacterium]
MKTVDNDPQYAEILAKYLGGEMSETELLEFESEIAVSEENKTSIEKMKNQWTAMKGYKDQKMPDTLNAWNKLHNRLDEEKLIPNQFAETNRRLVPVFIRAAAVILILLGIGAVIYLQVIRKPSIELVHVDTGNETNTLIKTLNDGSIIYIAQNSLFSFPEEFENNSRNVELKGEAFFDIASNPEKPFIIETDEAFIEVLGTAFNVKTQNGKGFELIVDRGKVKVTLKKDLSHSELVVAGEKINEVKNSLVKSKHMANQANTWYKQRMHFKDESLFNIISVLNRNFNTTFAVAEKETGTRKLTVTFTNNETTDSITELICVGLNLKSQNINGSVVFSENKENAGKN